MRLSKLKTNARAMLDGEWIDDLPGMENFRVRLKSLDAGAGQSYAETLTRALIGRRGSRSGLPAEVAYYINAKTLIEVCVLDWSGLQVPVDAAGAVTFGDAVAAEEDRPYSKALLEEILLEPALDGEIVTDPPPGETPKKFKTPDGKQFRAEMRDFLSSLVLASNQLVDPDLAADEKKLSAAGSPGGAANAGATATATKTRRT